MDLREMFEQAYEKALLEHLPRSVVVPPTLIKRLTKAAVRGMYTKLTEEVVATARMTALTYAAAGGLTSMSSAIARLTHLAEMLEAMPDGPPREHGEGECGCLRCCFERARKAKAEADADRARKN